ncbi:outer membrane protein [uncultured Alsobacter sp.]|uniref:outer membrane protein n=1 Tax=uncultured Alsobacter sp. TaxID=1748258 RepID=UPI0025F3AC76|nr:outer membrane protein [uncultured Alsobacter sp.]
MKKTTLVGALALGLLSTSAFAADLPSRKMAPVAPVTYAPAFTWTGFYVGANAGYGFGQITKAGTLFNDPSGFVGGGQIGYNYQMNNIVFGLEGDLQYADLRDKVSPAGRLAGLPAGTKNGIEWFGTVRPRVGFAADRALFYVTGGLAYGNQKLNVPGVGSGDNVNIGWTAGAGVEYAFTNNWTAKVEGLYVNLDSHNYVVTAPSTKSGTEFGLVRAGVNYKF